MILPARQMQRIAPFQVMELLRRARELEAEGRDIIHMEVGEPDFPTPAPVLEAARRAMADGELRYTPALGLPALREAIARHYAERLGAHVDPDCIAITPGASGALLLALAAATEPGQRWLVTDPGYPANRHLVTMLGGDTDPLPVDAHHRFAPDPTQVAAAWGATTRGLMVATPGNPTGQLIDPARLNALHDTVTGRHGLLLVDEIYQGLSYGIDASSILASPAAASADNLLVINSFSKYFGMTGWRLGWLVAPRHWMRDIEKLAQHAFIAASTPAQLAAMAAFSPATTEILETRRARFAERRNALLPALAELGFRFATEPQGAFYLYADISDLGTDAGALAHHLIENAGVATTPGIDFGSHRARHHLRFAYTTDVARLETGCLRIARALADWRG